MQGREGVCQGRAALIVTGSASYSYGGIDKACRSMRVLESMCTVLSWDGVSWIQDIVERKGFEV